MDMLIPVRPQHAFLGSAHSALKLFLPDFPDPNGPNDAPIIIVSSPLHRVQAPTY